MQARVANQTVPLRKLPLESTWEAHVVRYDTGHHTGKLQAASTEERLPKKITDTSLALRETRWPGLVNLGQTSLALPTLALPHKQAPRTCEDSVGLL